MMHPLEINTNPTMTGHMTSLAAVFITNSSDIGVTKLA